MDTEAHDGMDGMEGGSVTGTNNNNTISPESVFIVIIIIANPFQSLVWLDNSWTLGRLIIMTIIVGGLWRINSPASQMIKG